MLKLLRDILTLPSRAEHVLGLNARNQRFILVQNPRRHFPLVDDKLRTKDVLEAAHVAVPRTLHVFATQIEAAHATDVLVGSRDFVIKPASGRAGNGILVLIEPGPGGWFDHGGRLWGEEEVRRWICNIIFGNYSFGLSDRAFAEERLIQWPLLGDAPTPGLPDIRVITLRGEPVMCMLRLPTSHSHGKANLHQGAIGVGVDVESGRTTAASFRGKPIARHPDTGAVLVGQTVPLWAEILDVARRGARALPLGYLGMDIALDARRGPLVLEANARPGLEIQNANARGLRAALDTPNGRLAQSTQGDA